MAGRLQEEQKVRFLAGGIKRRINKLISPAEEKTGSPAKEAGSAEFPDSFTPAHDHPFCPLSVACTPCKLRARVCVCVCTCVDFFAERRTARVNTENARFFTNRVTRVYYPLRCPFSLPQSMLPRSRWIL